MAESCELTGTRKFGGEVTPSLRGVSISGFTPY